MAGILNEYLEKRWGVQELQEELLRLVKAYNQYTNRYLFIYSVDVGKARMGVNDIDLQQDDFYDIQSILRECQHENIDFYLETPGGSGVAAEEIARFLRKKFKTVNFVIAGEAKSAGTILALSGDNIYMTETGSLGPIDAQIKIGRSIVSAHDYKAWVEEKRDEAAKTGKLNPLDAVVIAQISPGEIYGVINSLEYAKDLVKKWLCTYKFKNWETTRSRQIVVTEEMKKERATEVAELLCNHMEWRTHGRSLKIEDLQELLIIENIDTDTQLADIVYRIKTVLKLIVSSSTIYKIFRSEDTLLAKTVAVSPNNGIPKPTINPQNNIEACAFSITCPKCGAMHNIKGYVNIPSQEIKRLNLPTTPHINSNNILTCQQCKMELDLKPLINSIEARERKKITLI